MFFNVLAFAVAAATAAAAISREVSFSVCIASFSIFFSPSFFALTIFLLLSTASVAAAAAKKAKQQC